MKSKGHKKHLNTHELKKADNEHGAYRPRMNAVFNEHADNESECHDDEQD